MVAAGVPQAIPDHAERLAGMALDMLAAIERAAAEPRQPLAARIGIASGPMMGGVIGAKRLTYDVWGDTVNLAARLESTGEPGRVHVSARTKALLEERYHLESRGQIEIRGLGAEQTWYLVGHRAAARGPNPPMRPEEPQVLTPSRP
jgi:adenylate cyclase